MIRRKPITKRPTIKNQNVVQEEQVRTTMIRETLRMAVKIRDNYYTVEYTEERSVPKNPNIDMEQEKLNLFESVRDNVYNQVQEIVEGLR